AFVAQHHSDTGDVDNIYAYEPLAGQVHTLMNATFEFPRTGESPRQEFGDYLQVDNNNQVLAWRYLTAKVSLGLNGDILDLPLTYLERWNITGTNSQDLDGVPESQVVIG